VNGKVAAPVLKTEINGCGDPLPWPRDTLYQKLALISPTNGDRSVGIVRLRTKSHGVRNLNRFANVWTLLPISASTTLYNLFICGLFNGAVSNSDSMIMNGRGCGRKLPCPNLRRYPEIRLGQIEILSLSLSLHIYIYIYNVREESRCCGRDSSQAPPEYKPEALLKPPCNLNLCSGNMWINYVLCVLCKNFFLGMPSNLT
jgi:hypothetical protein